MSPVVDAACDPSRAGTAELKVRDDKNLLGTQAKVCRTLGSTAGKSPGLLRQPVRKRQRTL